MLLLLRGSIACQGLKKFTFTKDKAKYKLKTTDLAKKYKDKFRQAARKGNITISEVSSVPESNLLSGMSRTTVRKSKAPGTAVSLTD